MKPFDYFALIFSIISLLFIIALLIYWVVTAYQLSSIETEAVNICLDKGFITAIHFKERYYCVDVLNMIKEIK